MLRPTARPANVHWEIQDAAGRLVGDVTFGCALACSDIATRMRKEMPEIGELVVVEVAQKWVPERTTRTIARLA